MRKVFTLLFVLAFALLLCGFDFDFETGTDCYVYDEADVFTDEEEAEINAYIADVREEAESDFLIVMTLDSETGVIEEDAEAVADQWVAGGNGYVTGQHIVVYYIDFTESYVYINEYDADEDWRLE